MMYGVILAAGLGKRMKIKEKKQFLKINNKPVLYYSIDKFLSIKSIDKIIIVINDSDKDSKFIKKLTSDYIKEIQTDKICLILGGKERYDSVYSSLDFIDYYFGTNTNDKILIHDSARPNFDINDVKALILKLDKYKAITLANTLSDTIKEVRKKASDTCEVLKTHDRSKYYLIKTPQAFDLKTIYSAYEKFYKIKNKKKLKVTDDLQIVEKFSKAKTYVLDSSQLNYKITTKNDLEMLKLIMGLSRFRQKP